MKEYLVPGYPTFIALNDKGVTIARWAGYTKDHFLVRAEETVQDPTTFDEKMARYAEKPTESDAAKLGRFHDSKGEYANAIRYYREAQNLSETSVGYAMEIFEATYTGYDEKIFKLDEVVTSADELFAAGGKPEDLILSARMMARAGRKSEKPEMAVPYLTKAAQLSEAATDPKVLTARKKLMPDFALFVLKDTEQALAYRKAAMPEGWMDQPAELNRFAWWCCENKVNLEEAQALAERGVELAEPGSERAMILDTLAEICNTRGDCAEAVAHIQKAIKDDPENKGYQEQLKRFQDLLAEKEGKGKKGD